MYLAVNKIFPNQYHCFRWNKESELVINDKIVDHDNWDIVEVVEVVPEPPVSKYTEHEKLKKVKDKAQCLGEFLEWLSIKETFLAQFESDSADIVCSYKKNEVWIADFFGIDMIKMEHEKRQMLEDANRMYKQIESLEKRTYPMTVDQSFPVKNQNDRS